MQPLGEALGRLHAEAVDVELLGELAVALELLDQLGDLGADGHALQGDDVAFAASRSGRKKSARQMRSCLGWRGKTSRSSSRSRILGVEDHQLVAVGGAGEVAEPGPRVQVVLLAPHPLQLRREALLAVVALDDPPPLLALPAAAAPVELEEDVAVEVGEDVVEVDLDLARAPEGRLRDRRRRCGRPSGRCRRWSGGASSTTTGFVAQLLRPRRGSARPASARASHVDQLVHRVESDEGVLAVEDARLVDLVGLLAARVEDPAAEVAVDRGAADQHRELQPRSVQLLDAGRHLLRGGDEQRGEADGVGLVARRPRG